MEILGRQASRRGPRAAARVRAVVFAGHARPGGAGALGGGAGRAPLRAVPVRGARDAARRRSSTEGLPGLHVAAHNPDPETLGALRARQRAADRRSRWWRRTRPTRPSSSRASKNYFRKAGLRVFSARAPDLHARGASGSASSGSAGPHEEGSPARCYCYFQIERIDSKERLRHLEHRDLLGPEVRLHRGRGLQDMLRTVARDWARGCAAAADRSRRRHGRRARSSSGCSRTTTSSRAP
mgnify:CR=1 FL=1